MIRLNKNIWKTAVIVAAVFCLKPVMAQDTDTGSLLGDEPVVHEKAQNAFKTTKVINLQSLEVTDAGVLDVKINHRFGPVSDGAYNAFGLDQAVMRLGVEYGVIPDLMVGFGRQSQEKALDLYAKYRILHQTTDKHIPVSVMVLGGIARRNTTFLPAVTQTNRLVYTGQIIIGRKITEGLSIELVPSVVHFNMAEYGVNNTLYALGIGARQKITKRTSLNAEYIPVFNNKGQYRNSLSAGFDIETGGHVFQVHVTNSTAMAEPFFIGRTAGTWQSGAIRLGFNISRVFTVVDPSRFKNNSY
ncbi:MAG: hypothetical protein JNL57_10125 [Bacteroidetes bacterium]|nr:hypothetical protein [Bacteroidota bacterium]